MVADMVVNMEVDADMEMDKVADKVADMVADLVVDKKRWLTWSWAWWPTCWLTKKREAKFHNYNQISQFWPNFTMFQFGERVGDGGWPKPFRPKAHPACASSKCQDEFRNLSGCVLKIPTDSRTLQISIPRCQIEPEIHSFPTMYGKGGYMWQKLVK